MRPAALFLALALTPLFAQPVRLGLQAGAPFPSVTEVFSNSNAARENRNFLWTFGPAVQVDLPARFTLEAAALYRRIGFDGVFGRPPIGTPQTPQEVRGNLWDFPLLAKYRFTPGSIAPFVGAGYAYRRLDELIRPVSSPHAFVASGGVCLRMGRLRLSPELRFYRWGGEDLQPFFRARRAHAEILVGVFF
jgi:hypothetical protein